MIKRLLFLLSFIYKIPLLLTLPIWAVPYWIVSGKDPLDRIMNHVFADYGEE